MHRIIWNNQLTVQIEKLPALDDRSKEKKTGVIYGESHQFKRKKYGSLGESGTVLKMKVLTALHMWHLQNGSAPPPVSAQIKQGGFKGRPLIFAETGRLTVYGCHRYLFIN